MVKRFFSNRGITLMELLIVVVLISVVFIGAISLYTSSLKFLGNRQSIDVSTLPDITLEQIIKKVVLANRATISQLDASQLNLELDTNCAGNAAPTPANVNDDSYWHYRFLGAQLLAVCDGAMVTGITAVGNPAGTVAVLSNLGASTVQITNPSSSKNPTVISFHVVSTSPVTTVDTEAALGASSK